MRVLTVTLVLAAVFSIGFLALRDESPSDRSGLISDVEAPSSAVTEETRTSKEPSDPAAASCPNETDSSATLRPLHVQLEPNLVSTLQRQWQGLVDVVPVQLEDLEERLRARYTEDDYVARLFGRGYGITTGYVDIKDFYTLDPEKQAEALALADQATGRHAVWQEYRALRALENGHVFESRADAVAYTEPREGRWEIERRTDGSFVVAEVSDLYSDPSYKKWEEELNARLMHLAPVKIHVFSD